MFVLVVACAAWVGVRGWMAKNDLQQAQSVATTIQKQILAGDSSAASTSAMELSARVHSAHSLTSDPVWRMAEAFPVLGRDLGAVRQVATVLTVVSDRAVTPLAKVADSLDVATLKPVNGAIDLKPLVAAQPAVSTANRTLASALVQARAIRTSHSVRQVDDAVSSLQRLLQKVSGQADAVDRTFQLLPPMLGDGSPRSYLILFQNNAELRAGGGNPGALALVSIDHGKVSLTAQANSSDFPHYPEPVLPLPTETAGLYGKITGQYIQDVTLTPQFPLSAALAREMWRRQYGSTVDGVLSVDPVALGYLLKATGPVDLPTGDQLTSTNAVDTLLSGVYARYPIPAQQDAFFSAAAAAVFTRVAHGGFAPTAMISALANAGTERRILLWSAHPEEQKLIEQTALAGTLPAGPAPTYGVYLNDATGAKMGYYLRLHVASGQAVCRKDGRPNSRVIVTLTNTAPADSGTQLSDYVTGGGSYGVPDGDVKTNVAVYAPTGSIFLGATRDKTALPLQSASDSGHAVAQFPVLLKPGESASVTLEFLGARSAGPAVRALTTPLASRVATSPLAIACKNP